MSFARAYAMHLAWEQIAEWQGTLTAQQAAEGCGWGYVTSWKLLAEKLASWWLAQHKAEETRQAA